MNAWSENELDRIAEAQELEISSLRRDGTQRDPVPIWVVRVDDDLYVRAVKGRSGPWYRGAVSQRRASISAGGVTKDVGLEEPAAGEDDRIDAVYREKYRRFSGRILDSVLTAEARSATLKLVPTTG